MYMGDCMGRSLPTTAPSGRLRKHRMTEVIGTPAQVLECAGRNASEPKCSVVTSIPQLGEGTGSVEPMLWWRRLERSIAGQETHESAGGIEAQGVPRFLPEDEGIGMDRLPGVVGMACVESTQMNHGRSGRGLRTRRSNYSLGVECPVRKSERSIVVMTAETTQLRTIEGAVLLQRLFEKQGLTQSSLEVVHVRR
jgi:hypothetical protein